MDNIKPLVPAKPKLMNTGNRLKTFYIDPEAQIIGQAEIEISDNNAFVSFCHNKGLSWFFEFFPDLKKFSESMGDYIANGKNAYIDAAKTHGLVVGKIGDASYIIAKNIQTGEEKNFCTSRTVNKQIFWGSALIFSIETYYPGGYTVNQHQTTSVKPVLFNQRDCYLSLDQVESLFSFSCEPVESGNVMMLRSKDTDKQKQDLIMNRNLRQVAALSETGEVIEDASVDSIGTVVPGSQQAIKSLTLTIPKFYGDVLIQLGLALKDDPEANFFDIPYDISVSSKIYSMPEYVISVLKDVTVKLTKAGST